MDVLKKEYIFTDMCIIILLYITLLAIIKFIIYAGTPCSGRPAADLAFMMVARAINC